ncbi:monocarboxylate transporter 9-like isoform X2 [Ooceraea biroi]|uniref:monocarboxylate transporter 9-like isoform X2 n=1 Tax=Ooceraea biroi TaxID=2015173 RepID=UPI0005BCD757|nr:monocarboxylate transporter 9-like isoform X2 [Ooceraea biroi]
MSAKVPPDGGWGWIVAMAGALNGLSTIPIIQGFGLVFKDMFVTLNLTATDTAIIINVNLAFGMILGLINGPLLKTFGYRKIAIAGSVMNALGITLTAFANSFTLLIICYGILASVGMAMSMAAFSLAVNSYFTTKRNRAIGFMMTIIGLGPILMPQLASLSLSYYGTQGTVLLLGAYSLHSMVGCLLLQPIKWHMKSVPICDDHSSESINKSPELLTTKEEISNHDVEEKINIHSKKVAINNYQRTRKITTSSIDHDVDVASIYGLDTPPPRKISMDAEINLYNVKDIEMTVINTGLKNNHTNLYGNLQYLRKHNLARSVDSINLGSSFKLFEDFAPTTNKKLTFIDDNDTSQKALEQNALLEKEEDMDSTENKISNNESKRNSIFYRIVRQICNLYDFDLLRDPIYVNIMLGMSIAIFAEANFSLLTPFILADMDMNTAKIATIMSVIAIVDLISRCAAPFLGEWLHQPPRIMYLISLSLLIISRTCNH